MNFYWMIGGVPPRPLASIHASFELQRVSLACLAAFLFLLGCTAQQIDTLSPPQPTAKPLSWQLHGHTMRDDYAWLQTESSATTEALKNESRYADLVLDTLTSEQEEFLTSLQRWSETADPLKTRKIHIGEYEYYPKQDANMPWPAIYRRSAENVDTASELILDMNILHIEYPNARPGVMRPNLSGNRVAITIDLHGSHESILLLRNIELKQTIPLMRGSFGSLEWLDDTRFVFTERNQQQIPNVLRYYDLNQPQEMRELLHANRPSDSIQLRSAKDTSGIYVELGDLDSNQIFWILRTPEKPRLDSLTKRIAGTDFSAVRWRNEHVILQRSSDSQAAISTANGSALYRAAPDESMEAIEAFQAGLVVWIRKRGQLSAGVLRSEQLCYPEPPFSAAVMQQLQNSNYTSNRIELATSNLARPSEIYAFDLNHCSIQRISNPAREDLQDYHASQVLVSSSDGAKIPVSLLSTDSLANITPGPLVLYAYGAYGHTAEPTFNRERMPLLEAGVTYAIAHVRGGGYLGHGWHDRGRAEQKIRAIEDYLAIARNLVERGVTQRGKIAAWGRSAGGAIVASAVNTDPSLFGAIILESPFVDVTNTMLSPDLPLTAREYSEWGDPRDAVGLKNMLVWAPYENISSQAYPATLISIGGRDPIVPFWEGLKWGIKVRAHQTGTAPIVIKLNPAADHSASVGEDAALKERALQYAFISKYLEVSAPSPLPHG